MPRRLPMRPGKILGNIFVLLVLAVMGTVYYVFVKTWAPRTNENPWVFALLTIFNLIFILLVWSFFQTMTTDPGQVPVFWGFHLGDPEQKRRRYCLMCNIFKPERCHHCSICNRCVLNMDHHCPWINNCVGFWNRKYFLLLLIYVLTSTYFVFFGLMFDFLTQVKWGLDVYYYSTKAKDVRQLETTITLFCGYALNCTIMVLMTMFLKFHLRLALSNKTTIENLDKKGEDYISVYDIQPNRNWEQIFGMNRWLWPFPVFCGSGKPLGDGIYWPTNASLIGSDSGRSLPASNRDSQRRGPPQAGPTGTSTTPANSNGRQNNAVAYNSQVNHYNQPQNVHVQYQPGQHVAQNVNQQAASQQALQPNQRPPTNKQGVEMMRQNNNGAAQSKDVNAAIFENNARAQQLQQQLQKQRPNTLSNQSQGSRSNQQMQQQPRSNQGSQNNFSRGSPSRI